MDGWIWFWGVLFAVTLAFYSVLVVYVTVGGFKDIKAMFAKLSEDDDSSSS